MIVLALLLIVVVIAIVVFVLMAGVDQEVQLTSELLNVDWRPSVLVVFLLGALCLFLAEMALALLRSGTRRKVQHRRELKRLREADRDRARQQAADGGSGNRGASDADDPDAEVHDPAGRASDDHPAEDPRVVDLREEQGRAGQTSTRTMPVAPGDAPGWHDDPQDDGNRKPLR